MIFIQLFQFRNKKKCWNFYAINLKGQTNIIALNNFQFVERLTQNYYTFSFLLFYTIV